tara:strand:- start:15 stop:218 length:204 start_codon:yes stop_codon:yes gene_type:complete
MAKLALVKKGKIFFGVCKGLEASGKGSALIWRIIFVVTALFSFGIPFIVYIGMAMFLPVAEDKKTYS